MFIVSKMLKDIETYTEITTRLKKYKVKFKFITLDELLKYEKKYVVDLSNKEEDLKKIFLLEDEIINVTKTSEWIQNISGLAIKGNTLEAINSSYNFKKLKGKRYVYYRKEDIKKLFFDYLTRNTNEGIVYVLYDNVNKLYKIGKTFRPLEKRIKEINELGFPLEMAGSLGMSKYYKERINCEIKLIIPSKNCEITENHFHHLFKEKKVKNKIDWFKLTREDLKFLKEEKYLKSIHIQKGIQTDFVDYVKKNIEKEQRLQII